MSERNHSDSSSPKTDGPIPDAEQLKAFRAFQRPAAGADNPALDTGVGDLPPHLDPRLGRRVYSGDEGRIYIVPGPGSICCIATGNAFGTVQGETTTALASDTTHGFIHGAPNGPVTFVGVVPATIKLLQIRDQTGRTSTVELNADDGYWVQVADPVAYIVSRRGGTTTEIHSCPAPRLAACRDSRAASDNGVERWRHRRRCTTPSPLDERCRQTPASGE